MERQSRVRPICNGELTNLLLFPEEVFTPAEAYPSPRAQRQLERFPLSPLRLSLTHITAEWPALLKRLGRRRQVLETILTAGRPSQLMGQTLIIEFPLDRRFHRGCSIPLTTVPVWRRSYLGDFGSVWWWGRRCARRVVGCAPLEGPEIPRPESAARSADGSSCTYFTGNLPLRRTTVMCRLYAVGHGGERVLPFS